MLINGKRALAYTVRCGVIKPIEGADNIELMAVNGWNVITKKGEFKEIHVMTSSSTGIGMPCFVCRQMISELFDKDAKVICYNTSGESVMHTVEELCPYPFGEEDLK